MKEFKSIVKLMREAQEVKLTQKDIKVDIYTLDHDSEKPKLQPFVSKNTQAVSSREYFFKLLFEGSPIGKAWDQSVDLDVDAIEILYNPDAVQRVLSFLDVSTNDESLKQAAYDF